MKVSNNKLYTFHSDIYIERPFFDEILQKFNAKTSIKFIRKKHIKDYALIVVRILDFILTTKECNSYQLVCHNPQCIFPNGKKRMLLNEVLKSSYL